MLHKITALLAISSLSLSATADELGTSIDQFETWKIQSEQTTFEIQVARSETPRGSVLFVNRSSETIDILDLNMSIVRTIKPFQTVDISASIDSGQTVAVEIDGGVVYLELDPGTSIITREEEGKS